MFWECSKLMLDCFRYSRFIFCIMIPIDCLLNTCFGWSFNCQFFILAKLGNCEFWLCMFSVLCQFTWTPRHTTPLQWNFAIYIYVMIYLKFSTLNLGHNISNWKSWLCPAPLQLSPTRGSSDLALLSKHIGQRPRCFDSRCQALGINLVPTEPSMTWLKHTCKIIMFVSRYVPSKLQETLPTSSTKVCIFDIVAC